MSVREISIFGVREYIWDTGDTKPTAASHGVVVGSTGLDRQTGIRYITYDGTNWVRKDFGYDFTINGVNFNGYAKIKSLTLDGDAKDDVPLTLHDGGSDYQVPSTKIFISFQAMIYIYNASEMGRIGEADVKDGDGAGITKEVLKLANGTNLPFMTPCVGVFNSDKFITAESTSASIVMKQGSILYGAEVDA